MTISTYLDLQAAVTNFTHRSDLATSIPDFIRLAEDVIYGDLDSRQQGTTATLTCTANTEALALPVDFIDFRSLSLLSTTPQGTLEFLSPEQYNQQFQTTNTGIPRVYTIIGNNIYLQPIPDQAYTLNAVYEAKLTNLSVATPTNWLLTLYPSVYLYASLVQAAIFMQDATQEAKWFEAYTKAVQGINVKDWENGANMQVKTDVNLTRSRY